MTFLLYGIGFFFFGHFLVLAKEIIKFFLFEKKNRTAEHAETAERLSKIQKNFYEYFILSAFS